ncbi:MULTISPECIES: hypothetical protein [Paenibacillus]|uniref:Uncharacterized protein n=1 Tax=Paenibacillus odorifer TaxID=189426 RepID=A0A1R0X2A7_9BACL|nr:MULTISPECIES: hypothetical protein [Paenibacillus]AIQ75908.1 hypothetical protein PODO_23145 [Paenibacillus odorifer]ETT56998.1 hypothetical protein C171_17856 [Paenibacillus sp. FSL H8-237]MEC0132268.1 hypothetical protein [Paenibacillus odorifer]MEC0223565.1 hypothetical protein [Paenibacillus odorifer]OMD04367.1 hypothetical protein BJP46_13400 [Paenibacillus odorifer]
MGFFKGVLQGLLTIIEDREYQKLSESNTIKIDNKLTYTPTVNRQFAIIEIKGNNYLHKDSILSMKLSSGFLSIGNVMISRSLVSGNLDMLNLSQDDFNNGVNLYGMISDERQNVTEIVCCLKNDISLIQGYVQEALAIKKNEAERKFIIQQNEQLRKEEEEKRKKSQKEYFQTHIKEKQIMKYGIRHTKCWRCHAPLGTETHPIHYSCGWLQCDCGACKCNYHR